MRPEAEVKDGSRQTSSSQHTHGSITTVSQCQLCQWKAMAHRVEHSCLNLRQRRLLTQADVLKRVVVQLQEHRSVQTTPQGTVVDKHKFKTPVGHVYGYVNLKLFYCSI